MPGKAKTESQQNSQKVNVDQGEQEGRRGAGQECPIHVATVLSGQPHRWAVILWHRHLPGSQPHRAD